ncbi:Gfo/Idh/MocA family oxidoreductase [Pedobacter cryoconitis]|uniref:Gfo/Idh/MocA family oxidoreductase n=1 Tax=Pedobacter cryoconitis TaxID=188932 RepID=UPI0016192014|nr:Gfo/Idh/MocA family oxidoreductase [Pedobacter cryoconitis]MBB5648065.1 putative dehydrogenase [Pedobacter cryoconitis]
MKFVTRIILIGIGPHSKRVYLPAITQLKQKFKVEISLAIDVKSEAKKITHYFEKHDYKIDTLFIDPFTGQFPEALKADLNHFVEVHGINAVIIATEPSVHHAYAEWALSLKLHILMDKPVSTRENAVSELEQANGILTDYQQLLQLYNDFQQEKSTVFSINVQRRYHPGFQYVMERIKEVSAATNCPVTAIHSSHSDGQWRLPSEMVLQDYHSYNKGHGKMSHSGYHIFDIVSQLYDAPGIAEKTPDQMEVISSLILPEGFIKQLNEQDYEANFKADYEQAKVYDDAELMKIFEDYGEIDATVLVRQLKDGVNMANITINLLHNSFSRRSWVIPDADLYKGNGRVKHEYHNIQQGPFQNIQIHSYQAKDKHHHNNKKDYKPGGNNHFDIYIFRNIGMLGGKHPLEIVTMKDLSALHKFDDSKLLTEQAKTAVIAEFLGFIQGDLDKKDLKSNIDSHLNSVKMMSAAYVSHIQQKVNGNPVVKI